MTQPKPRPKKRPSKDATTGKSPDTGLPHGITHEDLIDFYRRMVLVRTIDERIWMMNRQGKVPIAASSQGHEATQLGSLLAAEKDGDCFLFTYYRDLAVKMAAGLTPSEVMKSFMGKEGDPYSNGRQFPLQGADLTHNIIQLSNVVAAGLTQAVGYALASRMQGEGTVSIVYFGDGASSQGESHEAMNFAGVHKLPVVFLCENNGYAISVPQRSQMAITDIANRAEGYGLAGVVVDGMDIIQVYEATREAIVHARTHGPVLLEMKLERFMPHTTDDDDKRYRPAEEVDNIRQRDPVITMGEYMVEHGYLTITDIETISKESIAAINKATDEGEAAPLPDPSTIFDHLFKE
ncbi:MAG: thiamine pyrophosphate-dependent dehydrogenase E1 component subunit alpha [Chloroflexota bacterium]|nr:thiamine pyrophosphate-dependent dehydrogenase E1 component subunit alpha [Chloroflexota bacterium]